MNTLCFRFAPFNLFTAYRVKAQMHLLFILEKTLQNFLLSKVIFMPIDPWKWFTLGAKGYFSWMETVFFHF